jgi:hypothetical protein
MSPMFILMGATPWIPPSILEPMSRITGINNNAHKHLCHRQYFISRLQVFDIETIAASQNCGTRCRYSRKKKLNLQFRCYGNTTLSDVPVIPLLQVIFVFCSLKIHAKM